MLEPGNPQAWNRYSYVYNNPLRYTDPTGYFTNEAIGRYLNENYPDEAGTIWGQWYNNEDWWNMLQTAEAGDILFGRIGGVSFFFRFEGEGNHKLTGISFLGTDRTCSCEDAASGLTLRTLAEEGSITYTGSGSMSHELEPKWIGFVRGLDEIPALYIRTGYKWKSTAYSDWQRKKLSYTVGVGVGVLCHFAACPALVSILGGTGTAITAESTVGEIFHMGPTDVTVNILHIKTKHDYNIYFSKESLDADGWYIEGKGGRRIQ